MNTPPYENDALAALRTADPARTVTTSDAEAKLLVNSALASSPPPKKRHRLVTVGVAVAVLGVAAPSVAVATGYLAQTGWFGAPNPGMGPGSTGTESDSSEWIDISSPDYVAFAASQWPEYATLPPGYDIARFASSIATGTVSVNVAQNNGETALRQVTGIQSEFEQNARCAWRAEWLDANAAGDAKRESDAATALTRAAEWPATVAMDGGGVVNAETAVAAAASAGNRAEVEALNSFCAALIEGRDK